MKQKYLGVGALAIALVGVSGSEAAAQLVGQTPAPLAPIPARGQPVAPFFEGWFANPDGSFTLSFGYFNRNSQEILEIPIGPDNSLEPAQFNGMQPTTFPPVNYGGFNARRERGVFTITIPPEMRNQDVVWTIRSNGQTLRVPGRVTSPAYELGYQPMAMGSLPPALRFVQGGPLGRGPEGIIAPTAVSATVGQPVTLSFHAEDDQSVRQSPAVPLGVNWFKHQGPGTITFAPRTGTIDVGQTQASTQATFSAPGEYIVRARVDNHRAPDSTPADQCCWTNGYIRVNVQ
jgi:hypothetical protein